MKIKIILKSGTSFITECENASAKTDAAGNLIHLYIDEAAANIPAYLNIDDVSAILAFPKD